MVRTLYFHFAGFLGRITINFIGTLGRWGQFCGEILRASITDKFRFKKVIREIYIIGVESLSIILLTGFFTGMVLGLQGYHTLKKFGSEGALGAGVIYTLLSELAPVLSALLITGRAGSSMAAEIGVMRISDQIDQLDCMGINVYGFLLTPKFWGSILSVPTLTLLFSFAGVWGGWFAGVRLLGVSEGSYFNSMMSTIDAQLMRMLIIKSFVNAALIMTIASFHGFWVHARKEQGSSAVSRSTTAAVVHASVFILIFDYLLTSVLL
ncbi:MAG: ABC transporter permease [Candidatus Hydrogenedentota bacterium]|nr:MAG: ABC transporter permease [Candidatus Hydrogenedentota bacterium]